MKKFKGAAIGLTAMALAGWGCGGSQAPSVSSSTEEATVRGTVTVHGKAPTKGEVVFDPSNVNRKGVTARTAQINSGGTYEVKTLVGENSVTVRSPEVDKDQTLSTNQKMVDVKPGENSVPIELP